VGRKGARRALPMPALRGRWQLKNASAALAALDEVADRLPVSIGEIKRGLMTVRLTGRLQSIPGRPSIVAEGRNSRLFSMAKTTFTSSPTGSLRHGTAPPHETAISSMTTVAARAHFEYIRTALQTTPEE